MELRQLLCAVLAGGVLLEVGLRFGAGLGDPPLVVRDSNVEYRLIPSAQYQRFGNDVLINRFGMRAPDHTPTPEQPEQRILLIGDSVIYGNHFLDQSDTVAAQLTNLLQPSFDCIIRVMPAAASSWGPVNQAAFLKQIGTLDADVAILLVSAHDLFDTPTFQDNVIPYRLKPPFGAMHDGFQILWSRLKNAPMQPFVPPETRRKQTINAMDQMYQQLSKADIPLVLVYHPTRQEQIKQAAIAKEDFVSWASKNDIFLHSLEGGIDPQNYRDDIHPNVAGVAQIAGTFAHLLQVKLPNCEV